MKYYILITTIIIFGSVSQGWSQEIAIDSVKVEQTTYDYHIEKRNKNRTGAWIALGGGAGLVVLGIANNFDQTFCFGDCEGVNPNDGLWPAYIGAASMVASIPLFIAARKHNKAAQIELKAKPVVFKDYRQAGIGFAIHLSLD